MTSITVWAGVDSRSASSLYIASDSRITWSGTTKWNYGRKVFAASKYADILGYCGDVRFPSLVLGRIVDLIDSGLLVSDDDLPATRFERITEAIKLSFSGHPQDPANLNAFKIIYCTRHSKAMSSAFAVWVLSWEAKKGWHSEQEQLPTRSGIVCSFGSGATHVRKWHERWERTSEGGTSRAIFSAFCDSIYSGDDTFSGGAAQLVGLYRQGAGQAIGIIKDKQCFVFGLPVPESDKLEAVEWRNNIFERCDWKTKERLPDAQQHWCPHGLGK